MFDRLDVYLSCSRLFLALYVIQSVLVKFKLETRSFALHFWRYNAPSVEHGIPLCKPLQRPVVRPIFRNRPQPHVQLR